MREIDEKYVSAEAMDESGRLGYEFYRQEFISSFEFCTNTAVAPHASFCGGTYALWSSGTAVPETSASPHDITLC